MGQLGPLTGKYGKSRSFLFAWWCLAALFAGAGVLVLLLIPGEGSNVRFSGDISLLYQVGIGGLALGVATALGAWLVTRSQPTFYLHEQGVRTVGPGGERCDLYRDIEDVYTFYAGGIGWRASSQGSWTFAGGRISRLAELTRQLRTAHAEQRGERLYQALMAGETVKFRCLPDEVALSKSFFASRDMQHPTYEIELTRSELRIGGKALPIQRIGEITTHSWKERTRIVDVEGQVFHSMHLTALLSFDVWLALLERLRQGPAAA
ncbi:hypothetical protein [Eleftheria terrae]|uniref:hypothetical protein n=1 Tax=Eleftheria terrae TaxID=1597781 RepID=UPI00263B82FE|nr:hypothetical protein [Eleftheria terrae]WKB55867.1 hypothetical protein N7L95_27710 [Eleftheria terrae]